MISAQNDWMQSQFVRIGHCSNDEVIMVTQVLNKSNYEWVHAFIDVCLCVRLSPCHKFRKHHPNIIDFFEKAYLRYVESKNRKMQIKYGQRTTDNRQQTYEILLNKLHVSLAFVYVLFTILKHFSYIQYFGIWTAFANENRLFSIPYI